MAICASILFAASARAVGPEVRDSAGLFSPAAVQQADAAIQKIQKELGKELLIETFAGVPENRKADYSRSREEFFTSFVRERAQAARLNGIYVLVMKEEPPHRMRIQVGLGEVTRQRAFLASDRDQLVRLLQTKFREEKYDEGLTTAVALVDRTVRSHLNEAAPAGATRPVASATPAPPSRLAVAESSGQVNLVKWAFIIGGVLVAVFLVRMLAGAIGGGGGGGRSGAGGMGGMGGGGFFSSLLGGIGGAMAGSWLYDRFTGDNARSHDSSSSVSDAPSDVGGDYSSSGGDVGGSDFGGGGDDFGGGGGDV